MKPPLSFGRGSLARYWKTAAVVLLVMLFAGADSVRFSPLGHRLMCTCGCNQILLECNHVGCTASDKMRGELAAALDKGGNDDAVLQSFVQKYGATVLAAPTTTGFNRVAWIMPFAVLAVATWFAVMYVKRWQTRVPAVAAETAAALPSADLEALRRRARQETEL